MYRRRRWPEDRQFAPETESGSGSSLTSVGELARKRKRVKNPNRVKMWSQNKDKN